MIKHFQVSNYLAKVATVVVFIVLLCCGNWNNCQSKTFGQETNIEEPQPNKLRRIFIPFQDLNDWMKGKQAYLPMSYQRYANLLSFANRKKGAVQLVPSQHLLNLSINGQLQGESLFRLPKDDQTVESNRIDLSNWKLPAKFYAANPPEFEYEVDSFSDIPSMTLTPLSAGIDQDGRFGLDTEKQLEFLAANYDLNVSTGDLFDGHRSITLPNSAGTQTIVEIPSSVYLVVDAQSVARPVLGAATFGESTQLKRFLVTSTAPELTLQFSSTPDTKPIALKPTFTYSESSKVAITVERQDLETTILLEDSGIDDQVPLEITVPNSVSCRNCFVNGKSGLATLSSDTAGQSTWEILVTRSDFPLEVILTGSLRWIDGQLLEVPRVSVQDGTFLEGTAKVEARKPAGIQDFQLINCRFENAAADNQSQSIEVRYLAPDSQCRLSLTSDNFDQSWSSFARLNFQDDFLQTEQWIDHDLSFAVQTTLPFRLHRDWTVGQLVCKEIFPNDSSGTTIPASPTEEQPVNWYRDANDPNRLIANLPDSFLGKQIRLRFQGRRPIELGQQSYFEGLTPIIQNDWNRLIAVTSASPTIASLPDQPFVVPVQPELARQQSAQFASLIQLEPTFQIESNSAIPFQTEYRDASSYSVIGRLENNLLNDQLLQQSFVFQLYSSGSSVQQFPIQQNFATQDTFAWDLTDSDGDAVQFVTEVDANNSDLLWFKLQEPIATTLTLRQQRNIRLPIDNISDEFELPVYTFPEAVNFQTAIIDHSNCQSEFRYHHDFSGPLNWNPDAIALSLLGDRSEPISSVYPIDGAIPKVRCINPEQTSLEPLLVSCEYQHRIDPQKARSSCVIKFAASRQSQLNFSLPDLGVLDSVTLDGTPITAQLDQSTINVNVPVGATQSLEVRYTTANHVELFQWSGRDFRLTLAQPSILETQAFTLTDGLSILESNSHAGFLQQLSHRWLLLPPTHDNWSFNRSTNSWHSHQRDSQGICLINQRNLNAIKWLIGQVFLIVGFLFWSSILFIGGKRWTLNAPLLVVFGLLASLAPLPLAQISAVACWAVLGGHVLGYVRSGTQEKLKLLAPDRLMSTLSRSLLLGFAFFLPLSDATTWGQEPKRNPSTSSVVIPLDQNSKPGSVVYLDKETYQRFGELEKEMSNETRIEIQSSKYRLMYSPTTDGFDRLICEFQISASGGGMAVLPLPTDRLDTIANMSINGTPQGYTVENGKLKIPLPSMEQLKLSFESQIQNESASDYLSFRTIATLDNQLELRGVPTTWMVELYDTQEAKLLDRSFSKRTFQLGRQQKIGILVAADRLQQSKPRLDTQYNVNLSRIACKTSIQLGVFGKMSNRVELAVDSRLKLPARYYFATAGFQIDEIRKEGSTTFYEVLFPNADQIPDRFDIEWETDFPSVGQLYAPDIQVLTPDVSIQHHVGLTIDRRLLFQPNLASDSFSRLSGKRFPQSDNSDFNDPLDFVFSLRASEAAKEILLGELRMQPVQATGNLSLRYYVQADRILWDFDGQVDLSLGELPQLRLAVPNGFQLDDAFLSNDFQNQILWTKIQNSSEGNELICFLKEPMAGGLQIRLSGSQPTSEPISTGIFSSQLSEVRYQAFLFHDSDINLTVDTPLNPDDQLVASDLQFKLHSAYQLTPEMAAMGRMKLGLNETPPNQLLTTLLQLHSQETGRERLQATIVSSDNKFADQPVRISVPAGYGIPKLIKAHSPAGATVDSAIMSEVNGEFQISWADATDVQSIQIDFPLSGTGNTLKLPEFLNARSDFYLLKNDRANNAFQLDEEFNAEPLPAISGFEPATASQWYQLGREDDIRLVRRSNSRINRLAPTIEFQQFNYRPGIPQGNVRSFDGLIQWVVYTRSNDHSIELSIPEHVRILNVWVNQEPATMSQSSSSNYQIALNPTEHWHVLTLRLQMASTGRLPQFVGVAPAKNQFFPSTSGIDDTSIYRESISDVEKAIDLPVAQQSLLVMNRTRQPRRDPQSVDGSPEASTETSDELMVNETTVDDHDSSSPNFREPLTALIAQFPEKHMVPSSEPPGYEVPGNEVQLRSPVQSSVASSIPRITLSLLGIAVIAFLLWHPERQIQLLSSFVAIIASTYGAVALVSQGDWMIGTPLLAFGFLILSFIANQRLAVSNRRADANKTDQSALRRSTDSTTSTV